MSLLTFPDRAPGPELMDDPGCDTSRLIRTIRQFRGINLLFSASRGLIRRRFISLMETDRERPYTFLDIGAGGCDIPIWLAETCRRRGITITIYCLERDPRILDYARSATKEYSEIQLIEGSVFEEERVPEADFIFSNHFLHHFADREIVRIMDLVGLRARRGFLMNDLRRSRPAWFGYQLFGFLFLHRSFARFDGALSIRRGFIRAELRTLVAGLKNPESVTVGRAFPGRVYLAGG